MGIIITSKASRNKQKVWYTFEWGKSPDQRRAAGVFTYVTCKNQIERNHNREAFALLETKKSQLILEHQSVRTPYIPSHRFKANFLDYYEEFIRSNHF